MPIWIQQQSAWRPLAPTTYPAEKELHELVEGAPQLLPLSGAPRLVVLGREVQLGTGYADLLAVDPDGELAVIEVKLARNAEARRAVVSQVLAYAAYLHRKTPEELEVLVRAQLKDRGHASIADAVRANDQEGAFDAEAFADGLATSLAEGAFRLVLVLDSAPDELIRLAGYLEHVAHRVRIDLVTVESFEVGGQRIVVPQRVDPGRKIEVTEPSAPGRARSAKGQLTDGAEAFEASIDAAAPEHRALLTRFVSFAKQLEQEGLVTLETYHGVLSRQILLPRLRADGVGLVSLWNEKGGRVQFWRSVFEKRAPSFIEPIEAVAGVRVGQGNYARTCNDELLRLLTEAYREASRTR